MMKLRKGLIVPLLIAISMLGLLFGSTMSFAQDATTPLYLGITELKQDS